MESNNTTLAEKIVSVLKEKYEDELLQVEEPYGFLTLTVKPEKIIDMIEYLYNHTDTQLQYLTTLCGIHYPEKKSIAVMYQLHNMRKNEHVRLKIYLPEDQAVTPTLTNLFAGANWMERETYDFFGVTFTGHPNLRRILNVEDMIMFPMRKEFPLEDQTREDKDNAMFGR